MSDWDVDDGAFDDDGDDPFASASRKPKPKAAPGNIEAEAKAEIGELERGFRERAARERERFELATDSEYWVALCFQSRAQKEAFLEALALLEEGDKYIDGRLVARKIGITLPAAQVPYNTSSRSDRKLNELVRDD